MGHKDKRRERRSGMFSKFFVKAIRKGASNVRCVKNAGGKIVDRAKVNASLEAKSSLDFFKEEWDKTFNVVDGFMQVVAEFAEEGYDSDCDSVDSDEDAEPKHGRANHKPK